MQKQKNDIDSFVHFDKNRLDVEWERQPVLFHEYATRLAYAKEARDELYTAMKAMYATTYATVRQKPHLFGLSDKPTEAMVANAILTDDEYKDAQEAHRKAQLQVDLLQAAVDALNQRCRALKMAVKLFGMDYYSKPKAKGVDQDTIEKVQDAGIKERSRKRAERKAKRKEKENG